MNFQFGTKAETLELLSDLLKSGRVLPQIRFTVSEWQENRQGVLNWLKNRNWQNKLLIVRSSAISEDSAVESMAGRFNSVQNVKGLSAIENAISQVICSYGQTRPNDQVFIQEMLQDVLISGVAFSRDPNTGSPYIVINYDDSTHSTDSVTSGKSNNLKTFYYYKDSDRLNMLSSELRAIVSLVKELEIITGTDSLDIEFAFSSNQLFLLQVRPLVVETLVSVSKEQLELALHQIEDKISLANQPHPYLYGSRTVYGIMPDWNPAEIIGVRPRPLAMSLYKEILMDHIWAYQRSNYGYKNLRSFPLLMNFHGIPYVDARVSFNSFVPADIESHLAQKLINHYIDKLIRTPSNHDKVEFEIVYSCYTLDLPARIRQLLDEGFEEQEIETLMDSLRRLTNRIIHNETGLWREDIRKIDQLDEKRQLILSSDLDPVSKIYWLLEDCKRYGTLPFAGLARAGFVAVQLLRSLVNVGVLNQSEYDAFMESLDTVSSRMGSELSLFSKSEFLRKYGHLRPGTYDVLSKRYDEGYDIYFSDQGYHGFRPKENRFALSLNQLNKTKELLKLHGLDQDVLGLFDFIRVAIEGREYAKFVFTHSLSDALQLFKCLAAQHGFSAEQSSFANISTIYRLYGTSENIKIALQKSIDDGQANYTVTQKLILPPIIVNADDVWLFHMMQDDPNFITLRSAVGEVVNIDDTIKLKDNILFIPSADPGYDWIFSHGIAGFITKYGGVNSHMAIRAAELGIPAVIGAGEVLFKQWNKARKIEINCENRQVKVLA